MMHDLMRNLGALGIEHYGITSMSLLIVVFAGVLIWAFVQKQSHLDYMSQLALDNESGNEQEGELTHE
jgi:hypothetical protein